MTRRTFAQRFGGGTLWMWLAWAAFWAAALWLCVHFDVVEKVGHDGAFARDPDQRGLARQVAT
ncbi:MAG TPA: hypothetical protein VF559_06290 [Caulobacteraceae bacterium]|jgi:hypothetical protein